MIRSSKSSAFAATSRDWYDTYAAAYERSSSFCVSRDTRSWSRSSFLWLETHACTARGGTRLGSSSRSRQTSVISRRESAAS